MIFEIGSTIVMAGIAGYAFLKNNGAASNDADKIQRIFNNAGMSIRENGVLKTIRLQRKRRIEGGMEYVYQLPLGMSSKDIIDKKHVLEDGLNIRNSISVFDIKNILKINLKEPLLKQIKALTKTERTNKEIDIDFDGMLRVRVFNEKMKDRYEWAESYLKPGTWSVPIGNTRLGVVRHDFDKDKHLIIAGATGFGKSVVLKLIVTMLVKQQPDNVSLHLIDLKGGSAFQRFRDIKQTKNFTREPMEAKEILKSVQEEMQKTYEEIVDAGYEDIKESGKEERHFIIIDEAADIADDSGCMDIVTDIARRGRGAGYYLIYSTQYPSSQSITQQTKRNIPVRLCFVLDDATASNSALGQTGAEDLPMIPGRGIYKNVKSQIVQTPYISNKEIQKQISPYIVLKTRKEDVEVEKSEKSGGNTFKLEKV